MSSGSGLLAISLAITSANSETPGLSSRPLTSVASSSPSSPKPALNSLLPPSPMLMTNFLLPVKAMSDGPRASSRAEDRRQAVDDPLIVGTVDVDLGHAARVADAEQSEGGVLHARPVATATGLDDEQVARGREREVPWVVEARRHHLELLLGRGVRRGHRRHEDDRSGDGDRARRTSSIYCAFRDSFRVGEHQAGSGPSEPRRQSMRSPLFAPRPPRPRPTASHAPADRDNSGRPRVTPPNRF